MFYMVGVQHMLCIWGHTQLCSGVIPGFAQESFLVLTVSYGMFGCMHVCMYVGCKAFALPSCTIALAPLMCSLIGNVTKNLKLSHKSSLCLHVLMD